MYYVANIHRSSSDKDLYKLWKWMDIHKMSLNVKTSNACFIAYENVVLSQIFLWLKQKSTFKAVIRIFENTISVWLVWQVIYYPRYLDIKITYLPIVFIQSSLKSLPPFTNMDTLQFQHGQVGASIIKCGIKLPTQLQTLPLSPLKFANG